MYKNVSDLEKRVTELEAKMKNAYATLEIVIKSIELGTELHREYKAILRKLVNE